MLDRRNDQMKSNVTKVIPAITKDAVLKVVNGILDTLMRYTATYVKNISVLSNTQTWDSFFKEGGKLLYSQNIIELKEKINDLNNLYIPIAFQQIRIEINKTISCLKDIFPLASSEDIKQLESELLGDFVLLTDMEGGKADTIYKKEDIIDFGNASTFHTELGDKNYFGNFVIKNIKIKKDNIHIGIAIRTDLSWILELDSNIATYFVLDFYTGKGNTLVFLIRKDNNQEIPEGLTGNITLKSAITLDILDTLIYTISNEEEPDNPYLEIQGLDKQNDKYIVLLNKIILKKIITIMANTDWSLQVENLSEFNKFFTLDKMSGSGDSTITVNKGNSVELVNKEIATYNKQTFESKVVAGVLSESVQFIFDDVLLQLGQTSFDFATEESSVPVIKKTSIFTNANDISVQIPSSLVGYIEGNILNGELIIKKIKNTSNSLSGSINLVNSQNQIYFTLNCTVAAEGVQTYTISTLVNPVGAGTVSGGGTYKAGTIIDLKATQNDGYVFNAWNDGNIQNPRQVTVTKNKTYTANFNVKEPDKYVITVVSEPTAGGDVTGGGEFSEGAETTIVATPNTGYDFLGWWYNNNKVSNDTSYTFTVREDATYTAKFELKKLVVTTTFDESSPDRGTLTGAGTYNYNDAVTVGCSMKSSDDMFGGWFVDGSKVSDSTSYTFNVQNNTDLIALVYYIDVEPSSLTFEAAGGTKTFSVKSNIDGWTIN